MDKIMKAIEKWMKKHKGDVSFIGSFVAFDKDGEVIDDRIIGFGDKETVKIALEELQEEINENKKDFINW